MEGQNGVRHGSTNQATGNGSPQGYQPLKAHAVGLPGVLFMAMATMAPITAMTGNVPVAVGFGNGIGAPAGFLFATVVLTIFSVGFVTMARYITATGAFYGFISHGLGRIVGTASGLFALFAYIIFEPALVGIFAAFAHDTVATQLGLNVPWPIFAVVMLATITILTYFDIDLTAKILGVFLVTEIAILLAMAFAVLFAGGGPDGIPLAPLNPVNAFTGPAVGLGLVFAFWSWVGFETTAVYGEESRDPKRVVPQATLISVIGVGLFYVFVSWMAIAGNGLSQSLSIAQGEDPFALFYSPTQKFLGDWAVVLFQWLLITGSFACGMAFHNDAARYLYAVGREGLFNRNLGRTHPVHGSPHIASITQTAIATITVLLFWAFGQDPYASLYVLLVITGALAILIVQTLCSFAVIGYFVNNHQEARHWFRTLLAPFLGGIGMLAVVILLIKIFGAAAGAASKTLFFDLIPFILSGVFLGGIVIALYLRTRRPDQYVRLGRVMFEDATERPETDVDADGRGDVTERRGDVPRSEG